jgi:predicted acetyltransferase
LALDLVENCPPALLQPSALDLRQITDPANIGEALVIQEQVWNKDMGKLAHIMADELENNGANLSVYVVYMDGKPVSSAWVRFFEGSQFASLFGGSTLLEYRKHGAYTALLAVRAQEARRQGVRFLTVDAVPMSRAIVEKYGFRFLTHTRYFWWHVKGSEA